MYVPQSLRCCRRLGALVKLVIFSKVLSVSFLQHLFPPVTRVSGRGYFIILAFVLFSTSLIPSPLS